VYETEPHREVLADIARHLEEVHARTDFEVARDVADRGNAQEGAVIVYRPETPRAPAGYECALCVGQLFYPVDPTYGHPARNAQLLRDNPRLREDVLGLGPDDAAIVIEHWDRGRATRGKKVLEEIEAEQKAALVKESEATARAQRPEVLARITSCQEYLLEAWERLGVQDQAIWELIDMADNDPDRHREIVGRRYPMAYETYRQYLKDVPLERRAEIQARLRGR